MQLSVLALYVPYPGVPHAGGDHLWRYLTLARAEADVAVYAPATPDNVQALPRATAAGLAVRLVELGARPQGPARRAADRARTVAGGLGLEAHVERALRAGLPWRELARSDVVELQWNELLPLMRDVRRAAPGVTVGVMVHDVLSQLHARRAAEASVPRERRYARVMALAARRREPRLLDRADVAWTFSDKDRNLLRQLGARVPTHVIDPPLEVPAPPAGPSLAPHVLFTGYLRRAPNFEGVLWFLDEVWPRVVAAVPGARCVIAGADPPPQVLERAGPAVLVTGYVDDLGACYRGARAFVAPLRSGAGLKFKVPQAMLHGLPVVATQVAAEGVLERSGAAAFAAVTDDPRTMAAALARTLADLDYARAVGLRARAWAVEAYDFAAGVRRVLDCYRELAGGVRRADGAANPRARSFTSARVPSPPRDAGRYAP